MSAFMCEPEHIAILAEYAIARPRVKYAARAITEAAFAAARREGRSEPRSEAEIIGAELWAENAASVRARYPGDTDAASEYMHPTGLALRALQTPAVAMLKAAKCYRYQASESDGWKDSLAHALTNAIIVDAIEQLPGYEAANWGTP